MIESQRDREIEGEKERPQKGRERQVGAMIFRQEMGRRAGEIAGGEKDKEERDTEREESGRREEKRKHVGGRKYL